MEFDQHKPIYLQIADAICERILTGQWPEGDRIPSVRECGVSLEVNPNTVARSYDELSTEGIIHNKRGIGYFVSPGAKSVIRESSVSPSRTSPPSTKNTFPRTIINQAQ